MLHLKDLTVPHRFPVSSDAERDERCGSCRRVRKPARLGESVTEVLITNDAGRDPDRHLGVYSGRNG